MKFSMPINQKSILSFKHALIISGVFMALCYTAVTQPVEVIHHLTEEDGLFENMGASFFLFTSLLFLYSYAKSKQPQFFLFKEVNRNYSLLVIGLLFFFIFGEEISWGQRVLNLETGTFFKESNIQNETNLHNLKVFNSVDVNNIKRQWWDIFSMSRMFRLFWFTWCFLIPIGSYLFPKSISFFKKVGIPLLPPVFGILMMLNFSIFKFFEFRLSQMAEVVEIEECITAFLFFMIALSNSSVLKKDGIKTVLLHG